MKCLYSSRNNSFNHPIFQSKLLELLSRNNKNKKKITIESLSFRQKLSTSKISHTNSYINSNTNTNTNSIIKQSGNNTKRKKNSKSKININNKHKFSMSNDNFNEFNKKLRNFDVINTIYTTKTNTKKKNNYMINNNNNNNNNNMKRSKSKNNNYLKNEKSSKSKKRKKMNTSNKIMINLENDLSLKKENQRLKLQLLELQNEYEKLRNENDLLVSQNRNQNSCLSKQREKTEISNEKKQKNKINNLNIEINNIDNNYPCDYFNINNSNYYYRGNSPIHDYINSNKKIYNCHEKNILSYNTSKNNIKFEKSGNYFTIGNNDKAHNSNNNSKILNTSKNKIILSMYNLKNIKTRLNKSKNRLITQIDKSYTNSALLNTEKFLKNLKKNKIKEKLRPQQLIYFPSNSHINNKNFEEKNIVNDNINDKIKNIDLKKGNSNNLFEISKKNNCLSARNNNQNKNKLNRKDNIKNIIIKKVESNTNLNKNKKIEYQNDDLMILQNKMENIYQRAKKLLMNYDKYIENNIKLKK